MRSVFFTETSMDSLLRKVKPVQVKEKEAPTNWALAQSLLFAVGLRPTLAQATVVSWILKDGMQHVGKLICNSMGARMDSEPKTWCIFADVLYDIGTGLEVISHYALSFFLRWLAWEILPRTHLPGMAVVYSSFAKEGNLSDLFAKGEAISTLFNVLGIGAGIQLASTVCSSMQGNMIVGPLLSALHIYGVTQEIESYTCEYTQSPTDCNDCSRLHQVCVDQRGKVSSPADLRCHEDLLFPDRLIEEAGNVKVGKSLRESLNPRNLNNLKEVFSNEKFLINRRGKKTYLVLEVNATGEDVLRGWLVAAFAAEMDKKSGASSLENEILHEARGKMEKVFPSFLSQVKSRGWHTDQFLDGNRIRYSY
ncbi:hypothetical protein LUZ61_010134 [Rhynchospora tenuis]|uniref:Uncharacterized protein n=1 Tax=Rhynchospora tenuis TaxID=198213 RepID=A0AAD5ZYJ4_9POAL|nr:hypothetical protein LUZ61_010134 [Rhynchospora tenuis]